MKQIQSWTRVTGQNTSFILSFFKNPACASAPNEEQRQNLHGLDCRDDVDAGSEFPFHDAPLGEWAKIELDTNESEWETWQKQKNSFVFYVF